MNRLSSGPDLESPARRRSRDAQGFSLMEAIVATVIAVLAAIGLAYTFGVGRGNINRFEVARAADAIAQARMEWLSSLALSDAGSDSLTVAGSYAAPPESLDLNGATVVSERWIVEPAPSTVPSNIRDNLTRVTVEVAWNMGSMPDTARYSRLFAR